MFNINSKTHYQTNSKIIYKSHYFKAIKAALISSAIFSSAFSSGLALATSIALPQTGQTKCYHSDGTTAGEKTCDQTTRGQDGDLQTGTAWPTPRFKDNHNGTVTDKLTNLIWLKDASCDAFGNNGAGTLVQALASTDALATSACGLTDNSSAGDWRLPNIRELESLVSYEYHDNALSDTSGNGQWSGASGPFTDVKFSYWSNTSDLNVITQALNLRIDFGSIATEPKTYNGRYIWPVKALSNGTAPALIAKTGQTLCYDPSGTTTNTANCLNSDQDGELKKGVAFPSPRFTDNNDGTVTDNLTDLIWLQHADCIGLGSWSNALTTANALNDSGTADQTDDCRLTDGSKAGDWRIPNIRELLSLINYNYTGRGGGNPEPGMSNARGDSGYINNSFSLPSADHPFSFIREMIWSNTTDALSLGKVAHAVNFTNGTHTTNLKNGTGTGGWPVKGSGKISADDDFLLLLIPAIISGKKN